MNTSISIPLWVFAILILITGWALLSRILFPSVRWFLRRRVNRVLDEISTLLDIEIKPFQLTKRQVLIDRLVYDPKVIEAIQEYALEQQISREAAQAKVVNYAEEIVPAFNAYIYFRFGYWFSKKIARLLYRVRLGFVDEKKIAAIDPKSTVVFVMNHRSNMDYILVSYLTTERTALSYAVGEWARIWALQTLIKATGAFFVRRQSNNKLYRRVLERYVHMATREGVCQAVFIEGGLSKDGLMRPPKLGFLDYMLRGFDPDKDRDIVFIPIGLNYDRTLEDRSLLRKLNPNAERRSKWFVVKTVIKFNAQVFFLMARNRWRRFGFACVNFGNPISTRSFCQEHGINFSQMDSSLRFVKVEVLARQLLSNIKQIIPPLPVPIIATILVKNPETWFNHFDLNARVHHLLENLSDQNALISFPTSHDFTIETTINMLHLRHLILKSEDSYKMAPEALDVLTYYANSIAHWVGNNDRQPL
ncbi:MAG: 1-acyl-sn-glycerol-3-phosphate acyltransferase [SAR324 cluster bacterium]|nr:1-acyl-sn-glycerol-3-phosphate acyltransferase [SAR324 cluster bacterium]